MKLPKLQGCPFSCSRGNQKELTMIVEVHGIGFWTRVRLPPGPPKTEASNSYSSRMSSRLSIDWGTPRRSPFRYMRLNALFCVLSGFKPEEVLVYPSGFFAP